MQDINSEMWDVNLLLKKVRILRLENVKNHHYFLKSHISLYQNSKLQEQSLFFIILKNMVETHFGVICPFK